MTIKLQCGCGKSLSVKDEYAGRRVKCPGCQTLLRVPKPKVEEAAFGDEWDLGDSAEDNWDEEPSKTRAKSGGGKSSPKLGSNSRQTSAKAKGKKSQSSNRGLLIGLSAGGGLLGIAVLAWMFWPAKPEDIVAVAPNQSTAVSASTPVGNATSSTNTMSVNPGSQPDSGLASSSAPTPTIATKLEGDLKLLQGTWQVSDVGVDAAQSTPADVLAGFKQFKLTVTDDVLTMETPGGTNLTTMKLDSTKLPKTIDMIPLDGAGRKAALGIYSLAGDAWILCLSEVRPTEMLPDKSQQRIVMTLKRGTPTAIGDSAAIPKGLKFDLKSWQQASDKLKAMKVNAVLGQWEKFDGIDGPTHFVMLTVPETADGTMSSELVAIVSSISHVGVRTSFVTDATLQQLAQHPGLMGIGIDGRSTVTANGINALKVCPQLQMLMFHAPVTPEVCAACSLLKQLQMFGISSPTISKDLLTSIGQMTHLQRLSLQLTSITDEDLLEIQKLTQLKTLMLGQTKVTDKGLMTLAKFTNLTSLDLAQTKVTDQGLKTLGSFRGLKMLWLSGLNVTPQAVAELEAALPNCKVLK